MKSDIGNILILYRYV